MHEYNHWYFDPTHKEVVNQAPVKLNTDSMESIAFSNIDIQTEKDSPFSNQIQ